MHWSHHHLVHVKRGCKLQAARGVTALGTKPGATAAAAGSNGECGTASSCRLHIQRGDCRTCAHGVGDVRAGHVDGGQHVVAPARRLVVPATWLEGQDPGGGLLDITAPCTASISRWANSLLQAT